MARFIVSIAVALLSASSALAAPGDLPAGASRAELASPAKKPLYAPIDGRLWDCQGSVCTADANDQARAQGLADECHRAARWLGKFTAYQTGAVKFSDEQLAACNAGIARTTPTSPD